MKETGSAMTRQDCRVSAVSGAGQKERILSICRSAADFHRCSHCKNGLIDIDHSGFLALYERDRIGDDETSLRSFGSIRGGTERADFVDMQTLQRIFIAVAIIRAD